MSARTAISIATFFVVACLWYVFTSATGWVGSARFPNPLEFGQAVKQIALTGYADARIHQHVLQSFKLVLMGFAVAVSVGVPLACCIASRACCWRCSCRCTSGRSGNHWKAQPPWTSFCNGPTNRCSKSPNGAWSSCSVPT